jgi:hypothetical protein
MVGTLADFDKALARLQSGQGADGRFLRDPAQYESFRDTAVGLRRSIAGWRASDFFAADSLYTDWNARILSLIRTVDEFGAGPGFTSTQLYDSLNGSARGLGESLRDLRRDPQKYLRLKLF